MTIKDNEDFMNCIKCWICDDIKIKLNHNTPVVFHSLKNMIPITLCKKQENLTLK